MQEFTTDIKGLVKGLRPTRMARNTGMLVDCLNIKPMLGEKLVSQSFLQFPEKFIDTLTVDTSPIAREDFFYLYINETVSGSVFDNDADWNAHSFTVTAVNGAALNVGVWITANADDDRYRLNADGSFTFEPGADHFLDVNEVESVVFSYTISDGELTNTGTVNVVMWGIPMEPVIPDPGGDHYLVLNMLPGDTAAHTETGHACVQTGTYTVTDAGIVSTGGTQELLAIGAAGDFNFLFDGTSPWTIELLITPAAFADRILYIMAGETAFLGLEMINNPEAGEKGVGCVFNSSDDHPIAWGVAGYDTWLVNTEKHIEICFDNAAAVDATALYIYVNGQLKDSQPRIDNPFVTGASTIRIGGVPLYVDAFRGVLRGLRITKSILHTANFTPPTGF